MTDNERFLDELNRGKQGSVRVPSHDDTIRETLKVDLLFRFNDPSVLQTQSERPSQQFEAMRC
jgi:hypothetical protein